jgi:hypothetical protein
MKVRLPYEGILYKSIAFAFLQATLADYLQKGTLAGTP